MLKRCVHSVCVQMTLKRDLHYISVQSPKAIHVNPGQRGLHWLQQNIKGSTCKPLSKGASMVVVCNPNGLHANPFEKYHVKGLPFGKDNLNPIRPIRMQQNSLHQSQAISKILFFSFGGSQR